MEWSLYWQIALGAYEVFQEKFALYGESWRHLRLHSLTDLLYNRALRIRNLSDHPPATGEPPQADWWAIVNYSVLALWLLDEAWPHPATPETLLDKYQKTLHQAWQILQKKNADYGDAWQRMRPDSFIDFILMKLERIRHMDQQSPLPYQALHDNYTDILNYALLHQLRRESPPA
ncbi:MAG: DUF1599 domain-containing protein [Bacteroidia bacterium]